MRIFPSIALSSPVALPLAPSLARLRDGVILAVALMGTGSALAQEIRASASISTPFEVGVNPAGNYLSALIAEANRDTFAAATFYRETLRADPHNTDLLDRAFIASMANGDFPEAFGLAKKISTRDPNNGLAHIALGAMDLKEKHFVSARAHFAKSNQRNHQDIMGVLLGAWALAGEGDIKGALALTDTLRDESFIVFKNFHAGLILDMSGKVEDAGKRLAIAYDLDPSKLRLVEAYARNLTRQGKMEQAKAIYDKYLQLEPHNPQLRASRKELAADKPLPPLVVNVDQGAAETLYGLGSAINLQGEELAALVYMRLAHYLDSANGFIIDELGELYSKLKQYEQALDVYDSTPEKSPLRTHADIRIALTLEALGKTDEAKKRLQDILAAHPDETDALIALADIQRNHKEFLASAETYTRVLAQSPKPIKTEWPIYYLRGTAYERAKEWPKAEADFKTALELKPDEPLILNYLGYSWVDQGINLDQAFQMLRRAVELKPRDGFVVDSLGWAHYKLGHWDEAVHYLEKAVELTPSDPVINDHLGDAYWRLDRKLDAQFQWNHARDLSPEPSELPKILKKIEQGLSDDGVTTAKPASSGAAVNGG